MKRPFAEAVPEFTFDVRPVGSPEKLCLIKFAIGEPETCGGGV